MHYSVHQLDSPGETDGRLVTGSSCLSSLLWESETTIEGSTQVLRWGGLCEDGMTMAELEQAMVMQGAYITAESELIRRKYNGSV